MRLFKNPLTLIFAAALLLAACETPQELDMIPYPQFEKTTSKTVDLPAMVTFSANLPQAEMDDLLAYLPSYPLPMEPRDKNPFVTIEVSEQADSPSSTEGYELEIDKKGVSIKAKSATGAFYALQTLAQLARNGKKLPVTVIKDAPGSLIGVSIWMYPGISSTKNTSRNSSTWWPPTKSTACTGI